MSNTDKDYVIYSPNESGLSDGAGFWSNTLGWTTFAQATRFSHQETQRLSLPLATGGDAQWGTWVAANASYGEPLSKTVRIRLTLDVTYLLNGESAGNMEARLQQMCDRAIGEGMLTGNSDAEVEEYSMDTAIQVEPLSEDTLTDFMRQRIDEGSIGGKDLPRRLARYGLMEPNAFIEEMRERMDPQNNG